MNDPRKEAFMQDLQKLLNKHKAELQITDDGKPYGMHSPVANVCLDPYLEFELPCWMGAALEVGE